METKSLMGLFLKMVELSFKLINNPCVIHGTIQARWKHIFSTHYHTWFFQNILSTLLRVITVYALDTEWSQTSPDILHTTKYSVKIQTKKRVRYPAADRKTKKKQKKTRRFSPTSLLWSRPFSDTSLPTYCFPVPFPVWSPTQPGCWVSQPGSWCLTGTTPCREGCRKKQRERESDREGEKRESKVSLEFTQAHHKQKGRERRVVTVTVWGEFA